MPFVYVVYNLERASNIFKMIYYPLMKTWIHIKTENISYLKFFFKCNLSSNTAENTDFLTFLMGYLIELLLLSSFFDCSLLKRRIKVQISWLILKQIIKCISIIAIKMLHYTNSMKNNANISYLSWRIFFRKVEQV